MGLVFAGQREQLMRERDFFEERTRVLEGKCIETLGKVYELEMSIYKQSIQTISSDDKS